MLENRGRKKQSNQPKIDELTRLLDELEIAQKDLNDEVVNVKVQLQLLHRCTDREAKPTTRKRDFLHSDLCVGDAVWVLNPNRGQQHRGIIIGVTKTGFARVETANGQIIRRIPDNLDKIKIG
jgi:hypothetical protein